MSETQTPRTDEQEEHASVIGDFIGTDGRRSPYKVVISLFARELETELTATRARLAELIEKAFIAGAESVDERITYEYAHQRWMCSDIKRDLETNAL